MAVHTEDVVAAATAGVGRADLLISALNAHDGRPCIQLGEETHSYLRVRERTSQLLQAFDTLGIDAASTVRLLSGNRAEVLYLIAATTIAGTAGGALHPRGSLADHAYVLRDSGAGTLIFDPDGFEEHARHLAEEVPELRLLSLGPSNAAEDLLALADGFSPRPLDRATLPPTDMEAIARIGYTGGTTGRPKGVIASHRSMLWATLIELLEWQWPEEVRTLVATPLSHSGSAVFLSTLLKGGTVFVLEGMHFDPDAFLDIVERHRITATLLVPTMIYRLLDHPRLADADLSSLETIFYGASPTSPARLAEAIERLGKRFFQFYGQAEAPMTVCVMRKEDHDASIPGRLASCGRPVPWVRVQLQDDQGREVPRGQPGEICVRGPLVMSGYWQLPDQTVQTLAGGWLHTGDVATQGDDGFLTIVDRKKDMIISGGFNVYPREVEDILSGHPAVAAAAVIGVPDDHWGEIVTAIVMLRPGRSTTEEELKTLVRDAKGSVYAPKNIAFVSEMPTSAVGKVDKKALRARYWGQAERQVH